MNLVTVASALCLLCLAVPGLSQTLSPQLEQATPRDRHLKGLSAAEAEALIAKLKEAQRTLREGAIYFELLSGGPASTPITAVSPRQAFLDMHFDDGFIIERGRTDNRLWQPYKLAFRPQGRGQTSWQIEVVLGFSGNIERVEMAYKPPPPF